MHPCSALFFAVLAIARHAGLVRVCPGIEAVPVDKLVTQPRHCERRRFIAQAAEEQRVVHAAVLHQLQQALQQFLVIVFGAGQPQPAAHQVQVVRLVQRQVQAEGFLQGVDADKRCERLRQRAEVPLPDRHLIAEGVAPFMIGVVADEVRVKIVEKRKRPEIEGDAEDRHVVGVHHPVAEAIGLPFGDQCGVAFDDFAEHRQVRFGLFPALGEVQLQHMLGQCRLLLGLLGVVEVFEMAEAHMATGQAQHHRPAFLLLAPNRRARADHTQRPAARDVQCMQGF